MKRTNVTGANALGRRAMLVALVLCALCLPVAAATIVHPGRAAPAIVQAGDAFVLLLKIAPGEKVVGVALTGPHNSVAATIDDSVAGEYVYDATAKASCNLRAGASVPADCPEELYDLTVRTDKREAVAARAVKVVKAFRKRYTLVHVTDAHITKDWTGHLETGHDPCMKQIEQIVRAVNIIGPEFVIHTGDAIMDSTKPAVAGMDVARQWECFYEGSGGVRTFHGLSAPFFATAGNHDHFEANGKTAAQYAEQNGLRTFGFAYGTGRFMALDDSLAKDMPAQIKVLDAFLKQAGPGEFRALCQHKPMNADRDFMTANQLQLVMSGHIHRNTDLQFGRTLRVTTKNCGRPVGDNPGWFRVVTIEGSKIISNVALQYGDNKTLTPLLTLDYESANDGAAVSNRATITNGFDMAWPECKVRFVMKPGAYSVTGGKVEQVIKSDKNIVYDVRVPVAAKAKAVVTIQAK